MSTTTKPARWDGATIEAHGDGIVIKPNDASASAGTYLPIPLADVYTYIALAIDAQDGPEPACGDVLFDRTGAAWVISATENGLCRLARDTQSDSPQPPGRAHRIRQRNDALTTPLHATAPHFLAESGQRM